MSLLRPALLSVIDFRSILLEETLQLLSARCGASRLLRLDDAMDSNTNPAGDKAPRSQSGRTLTGQPNVPPPTHRPNESVSSRAALNPNSKPAKSPSSWRNSFGSFKKPQPAVFWSDKKSLDQGHQRTFFNDITPPPSPSFAGDSKNSLSIGYPSFGKTPPIGEERGHTGTTAAGDGYDYRYDYVAPQAPIPKGGSLGGLRRKTFWGIIIGVIVVIVLALAIGLGVGLSRGSSDSGSGGSSDGSKDGENEDHTR